MSGWTRTDRNETVGSPRYIQFVPRRIEIGNSLNPAVNAGPAVRVTKRNRIEGDVGLARFWTRNDGKVEEL
jgi:hypothetical protein